MANNKILTYILYALGEIFLVVIGILIAVAIDDQNQYKKEREIERKIVLEIRKDLEINQAELNGIIRFQIQSIEHANVVYNNIQSGICDSTTVFSFLVGSHEKQFYPKTSGYEALKSKGLNIIVDDSLRRSITDIYELGFPKVIKRGLFENNIDNPMQITKKVFQRHFAFTGREIRVPVNDSISYTQSLPEIINCNRFINDPEVMTLIVLLLSTRNEFVYNFKEVSEELEYIINSIDKAYLNE